MLCGFYDQLKTNAGYLTKIKKPSRIARKGFCKSRGERTRTSGLVVPNDARYRAALHPETRSQI